MRRDGRAAAAVKRVCVFGATGTIGRATVAALHGQGHEVVAVIRSGGNDLPPLAIQIAGFDLATLTREIFTGAPFDAVISCIASRTGEPRDAWAVDHDMNVAMLTAAKAAGVGHFILLSAICVQKPRLAFQHAKLAFEQALIGSGMRFSVVRPTAFFKSLSGQIERVRRGRPFLLFGEGTLTACKPISDRDLGAFLADCLENPERWNRILPIGGPGPAITPRKQGEALFAMLGRRARFRSVSPRLLLAVAGLLDLAARLLPALAAKAELARIGHYYATESMLLLNPDTGSYDAAATPETGADTLLDHYRAVLAGDASAARGDHAVFFVD